MKKSSNNRLIQTLKWRFRDIDKIRKTCQITSSNIFLCNFTSFLYILRIFEIFLPLLAIVVIKIPTVALISGEGSPTAFKHSALINVATSGGNWLKCALTLFFRIRPASDLVASSSVLSSVRTCIK